MHLTKLQKRLCNELQGGLPICAKPFDDLAKYLGSDEETVLQEIRGLKEAGIIRRLRALTDYRALGFTGTLVAAHVPEQYLKAVAEAVNSLAQVSHNYRREHHFNLWFTLQAESEEQIGRTLSNLAEQFDIDFHSLPVKQVFKLDVRFNAESEGQLSGNVEEATTEEVKRKKVKAKVELNESEKKILAQLQPDLELTSRPFELLCGEDLGEKEVLEIIKGIIDKGVIRRIAAVVNHRKLGFVANVLFCGEVPESTVVQAGQRLARFGMVSHCYERETFEGWPYNLFAMMHARSMGEIQHVINKFIEAEEIDAFELLPTAEEFKKKPVKYHFGGQ
ncbi:MAG: siroheme decarboxylase subunit beta [Planctomycetota bacterium]